MLSGLWFLQDKGGVALGHTGSPSHVIVRNTEPKVLETHNGGLMCSDFLKKSAPPPPRQKWAPYIQCYKTDRMGCWGGGA